MSSRRSSKKDRRISLKATIGHFPEGEENDNDSIKKWSLAKAYESEVGNKAEKKAASNVYYRTAKVEKGARIGGTSNTSLKNAANIWNAPKTHSIKGVTYRNKFSGKSVVFLRGIPLDAIVTAYAGVKDVDDKVSDLASYRKKLDENPDAIIPVRVAMPRDIVIDLLVAYRFANADILGNKRAEAYATAWVDTYGYSSALLGDPAQDDENMAASRERMIAELEEVDAGHKILDKQYSNKDNIAFITRFIEVANKLSSKKFTIVTTDGETLVKNGVRVKSANPQLAIQIKKLLAREVPEEWYINISGLPDRNAISRHAQRKKIKDSVPLPKFSFNDGEGTITVPSGTLYVTWPHLTKSGHKLGGEVAIKAALAELGIKPDSSQGKKIISSTSSRLDTLMKEKREKADAKKANKEGEPIADILVSRKGHRSSRRRATEETEGEETEAEGNQTLDEDEVSSASEAETEPEASASEGEEVNAEEEED